MQSLSFILVLSSPYSDMPRHLLCSRLHRYLILLENYYSQGRKKLRSPFHNSSPLTQYLAHNLFSVLYINLGNLALQNRIMLLFPNHWELIQTTEVQRGEKAVEMQSNLLIQSLKVKEKKKLFHQVSKFIGQKNNKKKG